MNLNPSAQTEFDRGMNAAKDAELELLGEIADRIESLRTTSQRAILREYINKHGSAHAERISWAIKRLVDCKQIIPAYGAHSNLHEMIDVMALSPEAYQRIGREAPLWVATP